ncbi:MAG: cell division protein FtsA [Bacteroidaceae bacterium]|nr:cell division protein FtsA [Bacteroidaceae bacterium]
MGAENDLIVAVELGSTSVRAIAGKKQPDGTMQIVAFAEEHCANAIRKGIVDNIDKTTQAISMVTRGLSEQLGAKVTRVYVGVAGQSMRAERNTIPYLLGEKTKITADTVDKLKDINQTTEYGDLCILDIIPLEYHIGSRVVADPVGMQSEQLEAVFLNVVARKEVYDNIETCVHGANLELADILIAPTCLADSLLTPAERRSGCALVDIGAETTTVAIYKNDILRHLTIIPLGGANVTSDICSLGMEHDEAELLKLQHGSALCAREEEASRTLPISFGRQVNENDLKSCSSARYEEIICNIGEQLKGGEDLISGLILTGGGAHVKNIAEAFTEYIKWQAGLAIRKGLPAGVEMEPGVMLPDVSLLHTVIALMQKGNQNCVTEKDAEPNATTEDLNGTATNQSRNGGPLAKDDIEEGDDNPEPEEPKKKGPGMARKIWDAFCRMLTDEE